MPGTGVDSAQKHEHEMESLSHCAFPHSAAEEEEFRG